MITELLGLVSCPCLRALREFAGVPLGETFEQFVDGRTTLCHCTGTVRIRQTKQHFTAPSGVAGQLFDFFAVGQGKGNGCSADGQSGDY